MALPHVLLAPLCPPRRQGPGLCRLAPAALGALGLCPMIPQMPQDVTSAEAEG